MNYVEKLEALDKEKSSKLIANGSKIHAQALIKQFIKGAEEKINIVSKDLSIYDDESIRGLLKSAFAREVKFKIILDGDEISEDNKFLQLCLENDEFCKIKKSESKLSAHIITRDKSAFRYCDNPHEPKINEAIASFNRPDVVKNAEQKLFGDYFDNLSSYNT